jgi:uncharacterized phiE125 gp8 family phage protein
MADYTYTAATILPVSLEDVKAHLNVSHATDDGLLDGYIRAATKMLEGRTNRCFVNQVRKLTMDSFVDGRYVSGNRIYPQRSPIANSSGVAISYVDSGGTTSTMPSSEYVVNFHEKPGHIALAYNESWPDCRVQPNSVTVTYTAGHGADAAAVPYTVKVAIQQIVAHWYRNREAVTEQSMSQLPLALDALLESEHLETYG